MKKASKFGILLTTSVLSLGMFTSVGFANTNGAEQPTKVQIQIASEKSNYTKEDLIKKLRSLFPKKFDFLKSSDFQMNTGHSYPDVETVRYELYFNKSIDGKRYSGSIGFLGEDLEVESFYYQPPNSTDALFPAKVSEEAAKKIATSFVEKFLKGKDYQLENNYAYFYSPTRLLTEPIRYNYSFTQTKEGVSIADRRIELTVLGNGEVVNFYKYPIKKETSTFDDVKKAKNKNELIKKVKANLSVELQYQINHDETGKRSVQLVYQPISKFRGVHASSGNWFTGSGYTAEAPKNAKLEKVVNKALPAKYADVTIEQARSIAEKFLQPKLGKEKMTIQSIQEYINYNGQSVISVQYMVDYKNGGYGGSLEIDKSTGAIIQYYDITNQLESTEAKSDKKLSQKEALAEAVKYMKELVPSYLHNYAIPTTDAYYDERIGTYQFTFPRLVNGIIVSGDHISVAVANNRSLNSLFVYQQDIVEWPSVDSAISVDKAKKIFADALNLKLNYLKLEGKENNKHYELIYLPEFNEQSFNTLNANTGEWTITNNKKTSVIKHPWAEEELNYLIDAKILDVKDPKKFNGDATISKGEAIKVLMSSITYFYDERYGYGNITDSDNKSQTFADIDPTHPLYQVIERASEMGIIKQQEKFNVDAPVDREELATWYIRVLGLEQAAMHSGIYKLNFADADKVQKENIGYVALADSLGILKADKNYFNPDKEVTYAELAVSTIRLAHKVAEKGYGLYY